MRKAPNLPQLFLVQLVKEELSFDSKHSPPCIKCDVEMEAYDAVGNKVTFRPEFHFEDYIIRFKQIMERVKRGYVKGRPRHIETPDLSCIHILSYFIFSKMGTSELDAIMIRHLLVTGCPLVKDVKFDEDGMQELAPLLAQVSINDFSIKAGPGICAPAVVSGFVKDILLNATMEGKILNGLDFPMWDGSKDLTAYSVDLAAWTSVRAFIPRIQHTKWWTAGTENTLTFLHIDCDDGQKLWGLLRERRAIQLSSIHFFLDAAVVLRQGDRLYMKPNTPHFVFGLKHAICYGSHYYTTSMMQQTLQGVIHAFVLHKFLTNTHHQPSRQLLRRILFFYQIGIMEGQIPSSHRTFSHLPNIHMVDGLLNFLSVAILVVFGNVLDFRTYSAPNQHQLAAASKEQQFLMANHDINAIPFNERLAIYSCEVTGPDGEIVEDLPSVFMVQLLSALLEYKAAAERRSLNGVPHCTSALLSRQVENVSRSEEPSTCLSLELKSLYSVEWKVGWEEKWHSNDLDYCIMGITPFDHKFIDKQGNHCQEEMAEVTTAAADHTQASKKRKKT
ncbi:hypothetical protein CPB84DRAFT_1815883 [Gymnopilus junonius]|uniref:JmjC domain-containing protein n=1 Tax=Gymnopilus junonius TaxID=109634 RepID=A0A9P5NMS1_GYMJU|nr:hypothetical protein CPB84DRAFT_1815883 [Gymnopilus junonius]